MRFGNAAHAGLPVTLIPMGPVSSLALFMSRQRAWAWLFAFCYAYLNAFYFIRNFGVLLNPENAQNERLRRVQRVNPVRTQPAAFLFIQSISQHIEHLFLSHLSLPEHSIQCQAAVLFQQACPCAMWISCTGWPLPPSQPCRLRMSFRVLEGFLHCFASWLVRPPVRTQSPVPIADHSIPGTPCNFQSRQLHPHPPARHGFSTKHNLFCCAQACLALWLPGPLDWFSVPMSGGPAG